MTSTVVRVIAAIVLLALASLAFTLAPNEEQRQAPMETTIEVGGTGMGRNIEATVHDVRLAEVAQTDTFEPWIGETNGVWVIVDATVASGVNPVLMQAWLTVDGLTYDASGRPEDASIVGDFISPGIPRSGSVLFEIPREIAESSTPVRITFAPGRDVRLDSTVVLSVRLDELTIEPSAILWENKLGGRPS